MVDMILFPSSYFNLNKVDDELWYEYNVVISADLYEVVLFGYDQWFNDSKLVLNHSPEKLHTAVYRGWMMKPEQYESFYKLLLKKNIRLITDPKQYKLMHIFPNVYDFVKEDTAKMEIYPLYEHIDVERLKSSFDRFMVKDFVKSVKGTEFPKYFDKSITQSEFDDWMKVFYKYRGNLLTGGICIKEFLSLKFYGSRTNEYRVFYINHEPATISRNSGQGIFTPLPPRDLINKYKDLESNFYTIDYAELENGTWKIIEAGDGNVSGLSENQDYEEFFRVLYKCFNFK